MASRKFSPSQLPTAANTNAASSSASSLPPRNIVKLVANIPGGEVANPQLQTSAESIDSRTSIRGSKSYIRPYYRSRLIAKSEIAKPWLKDPKPIWPTAIPCIGFACGLAVMAVMVWLGVNSVPRHNYCLIMQDDFEAPSLDKSMWNKEVQLGGYG